MNTRPVSHKRARGTPRDWLSLSDSSRPEMSVGRRCDWSSTKGLASASSSAAVCGHPGREFLRRAQRVVDALVEMLADEIVGDLAVEDARSGHRRRPPAPGRSHSAAGTLLGAVKAQHFLDEIDRPVEIVALARNRDGPRRAAGRWSFSRTTVRFSASSAARISSSRNVEAELVRGCKPGVTMISRCHGRSPPTLKDGPTTEPPAVSRIRSIARYAASSVLCGSTPRSKR